MSVDRVCTVQARMACLAEAIAFVASFCDAQGVAREDGLRMALIVEELFTNSVTHGHCGDCDAPVRIALKADASELELCYDDTAPPFDPFEHASRSAPGLDASVQDRPVGQLGIALVASMAVRVGYLRDDGWNRIRLALRRQA